MLPAVSSVWVDMCCILVWSESALQELMKILLGGLGCSSLSILLHSHSILSDSDLNLSSAMSLEGALAEIYSLA